MKKSITINRINHSETQITGEMVVFGDDEILFSFHTLELPDINNAPQISCIPLGKYTVKKRHSPKFGEHFHVLEVPNRKYILIHRGNFYTDIRGCILVGSGLMDINGDGIKDVTNSKNTMKVLVNLMPDEFELNII